MENRELTVFTLWDIWIMLLDQQRLMASAFFQTNPTSGDRKLSIVNDLVIVFKDQIDKTGNGMTVGWEWK